MAKVLDQIPAMDTAGTITLWLNALTILNDPKKWSQHGLAQQVVIAVGVEWDRRRQVSGTAAGGFRWPSTEATWGSGNLSAEDWTQFGVLAAVGYKVGANGGLPEPLRRRILDEVFAYPIPPVGRPDYMEEWGRHGSVTRLRKMAETIAALARNAKRRREASMDVAIRHWEADLKHLHDRHYAGLGQFAWPSSAS